MMSQAYKDSLRLYVTDTTTTKQILTEVNWDYRILERALRSTNDSFVKGWKRSETRMKKHLCHANFLAHFLENITNWHRSNLSITSASLIMNKIKCTLVWDIFKKLISLLSSPFQTIFNALMKKFVISLLITLYYFKIFFVPHSFSDERRNMLTIAGNYLFLML